MGYERHVKLFKDGERQAIHIPRDFELPGTEVVMRKDGDRIVIEPVVKQSLLELLDSLEPIDEDFGPIDDPLPGPVNL